MENKKIGTGLIITVIGLTISILSCIAAWIMVPAIGDIIFPEHTKTNEDLSPSVPESNTFNQNGNNIQETETERIASFNPTPAEPDPNNLVYNGYFLGEFDGWQRELIDEGGGSKTNIVSFGSSLFNRALKIEHEGLGQIYFYQDVDIPSINLDFSCSFSANATTGPIWGFSGTGYAIIGLIYSDSLGNELGYTRILNWNENPFAGTGFVGVPDELSDTNTSNTIEIEAKKTYSNYSINIRNEIQNNLLGINPKSVDSIRIILIAGSNDKDATAELTIADVVLKENK